MANEWLCRFISYRQSYTHHPASKRTQIGGRFGNHVATDSERAGLMSDLDHHDGDAVIEMDLLPPRWLDIQDDINTHLSDIASKMKKLEQLHAKHVLPGFDDESVKAKEEREIENLTQEITRGFSTCQRAIKRIETMLREQQTSQGGTLTSADETMAKNLRISLASRVGDVSALFRKKQAAYLKKLRSLGGMASPFGDRSGTPVGSSSTTNIQNPYTDPAISDSLADRSSAQHTLTQTAQQLHLRQTTTGGVHDAAILQREREIEKIAQGVIDLSNIFQELNSMVIDQGSLLDRIDYNVERTAEHVKQAEGELKVATGHQKKGVRRKVILLLVLLVVGMFILVLVKPRRRGGQQAPVDAAPLNPPGDGIPPRVMVGRWKDGGDDRRRREVVGLGRKRRRVEWKKRRRRRWQSGEGSSLAVL